MSFVMYFNKWRWGICKLLIHSKLPPPTPIIGDTKISDSKSVYIVDEDVSQYRHLIFHSNSIRLCVRSMRVTYDCVVPAYLLSSFFCFVQSINTILNNQFEYESFI